MSEPSEQAKGLLQRANQIVLVTHERPDGDAVGSLLALAAALQAAGKKATPLMVSGLPGRYGFLPMADQVRKSFPEDCDLLIAVDCAAGDRTGFPQRDLPRPIDINIDHHPTNTQFAAVNLIQEGAASTTEILFELIPAWDLPLDSDVATNLLTGLLTDTIGFRTSSTRPQSLRVAASLMELGAPLADLYDRAISRMSFVAANYWGNGLSRMNHEDGLVWTSLTLADRHAVGYPGADDADLVNLLMTIEEARVVVLFVEQPGGRIKVSWRAEPGVDVSKVAESFSGGGHKPAAGATIEGSLPEVQPQVLEATREAMKAAE